jgi:hypothetical protein
MVPFKSLWRAEVGELVRGNQQSDDEEAAP